MGSWLLGQKKPAADVSTDLATQPGHLITASGGFTKQHFTAGSEFLMNAAQAWSANWMPRPAQREGP